MIRIIILALLLSGCNESQKTPERDEVFARIRLVDDIPQHPGAYGYATCNEGVCDIQIRRDIYPDCITHEIRHGFEGLWHGDTESMEDCKVER